MGVVIMEKNDKNDIKVISFKDQENAIYYDYISHLFYNTYDNLTVKDMFYIIEDCETEDVFYNVEELDNALNDYYENKTE